jgi:N6-L-threonylcarbamoyladenine synthase
MKRTSTILAIESSCDETAAAVLVDGKVKSSIIASQAQIHAKFGGVVPEIAARSHITAILPTIDQALKKAHVGLSDVNLITVTQGPGLATSLMVGVDTAQALGAALNIPVMPINHLEAHIYANFVGENQKSKIKNQKFPAIVLTVSGGHTMLVLMAGHGKYKILGETIDDAAGEAFDKTAKMLGLGYPGGVQISKLAKLGNPQAYNFPRPMINSDDLNFSFSGLKTAVLYKIMGKKFWNKKQKADIAASVQQAIVDVLIAKLEKAIIKYRPKTIMLGGGVAANELLRKRFKKIAITYNLSPITPPLEYCTDNAAMIGLAAYYKIKDQRSKIKDRNFSAKPNLRLK